MKRGIRLFGRGDGAQRRFVDAVKGGIHRRCGARRKKNECRGTPKGCVM